MKATAKGELALRLLELEQRFGSYCTLHEAEMVEIKAALDELRRDLLRLGRDLASIQDTDCGQGVDGGVDQEDVSAASSALTL